MKKYLLQVKIVNRFQSGTFSVINNLPSCPVQEANEHDEAIYLHGADLVNHSRQLKTNSQQTWTNTELISNWMPSLYFQSEYSGQRAALTCSFIAPSYILLKFLISFALISLLAAAQRCKHQRNSFFLSPKLSE
jgi:hypothetical protein